MTEYLWVLGELYWPCMFNEGALSNGFIEGPDGVTVSDVSQTYVLWLPQSRAWTPQRSPL